MTLHSGLLAWVFLLATLQSCRPHMLSLSWVFPLQTQLQQAHTMPHYLQNLLRLPSCMPPWHKSPSCSSAPLHSPSVSASHARTPNLLFSLASSSLIDVWLMLLCLRQTQSMWTPCWLMNSTNFGHGSCASSTITSMSSASIRVPLYCPVDTTITTSMSSMTVCHLLAQFTPSQRSSSLRFVSFLMKTSRMISYAHLSPLLEHLSCSSKRRMAHFALQSTTVALTKSQERIGTLSPHPRLAGLSLLCPCLH